MTRQCGCDSTFNSDWKSSRQPQNQHVLPSFFGRESGGDVHPHGIHPAAGYRRIRRPARETMPCGDMRPRTRSRRILGTPTDDVLRRAGSRLRSSCGHRFDRDRPPNCRAVTDTRHGTGLAIMTGSALVTAVASKCNCRKCFQYRLCRVKYENWVGSSSASHPPHTTDCLKTGHGATRARLPPFLDLIHRCRWIGVA